MNRLLVGLLFALAACDGTTGAKAPAHGQLIFAAVEGDGAVAAIDGATGALIERIDLGVVEHGMATSYQPHNVQGSPDGKTVWATAHPPMDSSMEGMPMPDQLIGIDVETLSVRSRIPLGEMVHAAHVVIRGSTAWVTANLADLVYVVDLDAGQVVRTLPLPSGAGPHGERLSPDGGKLFVAGMGTEGSLLVVDTATGEVEKHELPAPAVQTAVLPDGSAAFATILARAQVARLDLRTGDLLLIDLPEGAAGPAQIYPSPDSASVWVADQGVLVPGSTGHRAYQLDAASGATLQTVELGQGPHGVVVEPDGARAWIANAADGTVQSVDTATGEVLTTAPVGNAPNGITCVHRGGATP